jgi:cell division inhibitor SepF
MGRLQKAMSFLGLADDDYDDFEPYDEPMPSGPVRVRGTADPDPNIGAVRTLPRDDVVTPVPQGVVPRPVVRPVSGPKTTPKVHVVVVEAFAKDAEQIATHAREGDFVLMNLQGVAGDLARRLVDFAAGLQAGLMGKMERTADKVYLLRPADSEMPEDEKARLAERGLYS